MELENGGACPSWCHRKAILEENTTLRSSPWGAILPLSPGLDYMWPNWLFSSKDWWFDLFSAILFPNNCLASPLPGQSIQPEGKGRAPMHPLHICPLGYPIGSPATWRCILEPERSGLLALIKRLKSWLNIHIPHNHLRWRNLKCMVRWILGVRPRLENRSVVRVRERRLTLT